MSTFSILRYNKSAAIAPKQGEVLSLDVALSNGRQETLEIHIRRYEKRPVFLIPRLGELGGYQSATMQSVLQAVSSAYAGVLSLPYAIKV